MSTFPKKLAKNISEMIGNPLLVLLDDIEQHCIYSDGANNTGIKQESGIDAVASNEDVVQEALDLAMQPCNMVEALFQERGVILTQRERSVVRLLADNYDVRWAAKQLDISVKRVYDVISQLKNKAVIV